MSNHAHSHAYVPPTIPIVVQVGFAGSRNLFNASQHHDLDPADLEAQAFERLLERLVELRVKLGLCDQHVLCGISQIAVGADTLFTRACEKLGIAQRVLLPQNRDDFLSAVGPDGVRDFSPAEETAARELLRSPHIIEERVVSHARDRDTRFEEANSAIVHESDVILCLVRDGARGKPGGTEDLIVRAEIVRKPVVTLGVSINAGKVTLDELPPTIPWTEATDEGPPTMPAELAGLQIGILGDIGKWPPAETYIGAIKNHASERSKKHGIGFRNFANVIIGCHVAATLLAIIVGKLPLTFHGDELLPGSTLILALLVGEIMLLITGAGHHYALHHGGRVGKLVSNRLIAEIMRSLTRIGTARGDFKYVFLLPVPQKFEPVLRTCDILLLRNAPYADGKAWAARRDNYVRERLTDPISGQISYYGSRALKAERHLFFATFAFWFFTILAVLMATAELYLGIREVGNRDLAAAISLPQSLIPSGVLNALAAFFPVVAVGALSWAAASDLHGRAQTFAEMQKFLEDQLRRFSAAASEREFVELVRETETRLLSENLNWYWRRAFATVG
ncbi:MAG TPA: hypothetical protein VMJ11_28555 [Paraburkholderia sp.]|uniref:hypothetical protein n=1 Tax=Paraburkholderia sp. TaxID=1926495 RepID=UPI002BD9CFFF|nr:hypothetical protein [Paraburkholderia sp.]HTR10544.1 hypothetical protein [Paraburkholderia sp.]